MFKDVTLKVQRSSKQTAELAVESGTEAATVRYQDERQVDVGDRLTLVDAETEVTVAVAEVVHARLVPVWRVLDVIQARGALYATSYASNLLKELNHYYDDVGPTDHVKVIIYSPTGETHAPDK